jgi:ATP-dependent protease ClpP protease subunit
LINVYGYIGGEFLDAASIVSLLPDSGPVEVAINSAGGEVSEATAIYNRLRDHDGEVTVYVDGLAASAASLIAMAGDRVVMRTGSVMMVHEPWMMAVGSAGGFRRLADELDIHTDAMLEIYAAKTKLPANQIRALLEDETWMTASAAVELGFADEKQDNRSETGVAEALAWNHAAAVQGARVPVFERVPDYIFPQLSPEVAAAFTKRADTPTDNGVPQMDVKELSERLARIEQLLAPAETPQPSEELAAAEALIAEQAERIAALEREAVVAEARSAGATDEEVEHLVQLRSASPELYASHLQRIVAASQPEEIGTLATASATTKGDDLVELYRQAPAGSRVSALVKTHGPERAQQIITAGLAAAKEV